MRSLSSHAWTLTIKGLLNTVRPTFQKRAAMTLEHLTALVQTCHLRESFTPLKVAVTFGFFAFLRISNLAPPTVGLFDPTRHTTFRDVQQSDDGIVLNLRWTKTGQNASHSVGIPLPALGASLLCPAQAWKEYKEKLRRMDIKPHTPLLVTTEEPKGRPITIPLSA